MSVKDLVDIFIPSADASPATVARWRQLTGTALVIISAAIFCIYIIKANASELDDVKTAVYIPAMEKAHQRYCLSTNEDTRLILRQQVQSMQIEYQRITGVRYPLETCEEIRRQNANSR